MAGALVDHYVLAMAQPREVFVANSPYPFLVGTAALVHSDASTEEFPRTDVDANLDRPKLVALAVRNARADRERITVGRTIDNDLPLQHMRISRHHAHFTARGERWELFDDGSRNGTSVEGNRLVPKGPGQIVTLGQALRFAELEFTFLDAGRCWELLHHLTRRPTH